MGFSVWKNLYQLEKNNKTDYESMVEADTIDLTKRLILEDEVKELREQVDKQKEIINGNNDKLLKTINEIIMINREK